MARTDEPFFEEVVDFMGKHSEESDPYIYKSFTFRGAASPKSTSIRIKSLLNGCH